MVRCAVGGYPSNHMAGVPMTYDFSAFRTNAPRQLRVLEANVNHLLLLRERNAKGFLMREVYMVAHGDDGFTLYRAGQYEEGYRMPQLLRAPRYAILQAKEIHPILAALGYDVKPLSF